MRKTKGAYQISEFAVALLCLLLFALPLINLAIVPMRYGLAKSLIESHVHKCAHAQLLSQALARSAGQDATLSTEPNANRDLSEALRKIGGIEVSELKTYLEIEAAKKPQEKKVIERGAKVSADWLPDGPLGPYIYRLHTHSELKIAPLALVKLGGLNVPGLTVPLPVTLEDQCIFENLGRDPNTGEYFINE